MEALRIAAQVNREALGDPQEGQFQVRKTSFIIIAILASASLVAAQTPLEANQDTTNRRKDTNKHQAGLYLIVAEADSADSLPPAASEQQVVRYVAKFLRDSEKGESRYLLLPKTADVSLLLARAPELLTKGENGFPELRLELTPETASNLEKVTREHIGGKVAFVIDDEPVTLHKIRSAITGAQFRLSRCTDTACQYIYGRLVEMR